ncbi:Receptor-type tyrosine-protein phosphatase C [Aphelenchoides besseyi]|nr:Receptor-type tyrosine-protein phosphatase C [Aphelenchoides besseyi]
MADRHKLLNKLKNRFLKENKGDKKQPTREEESGREKKSVKEKTASKRERRRKTRNTPSVSKDRAATGPTEETEKKKDKNEGSQRGRKKKRGTHNKAGVPQETVMEKVDYVDRTEKPGKMPSMEKPPVDPHADERNKWAAVLLDKGARALAKEFREATAAYKSEPVDASVFYERANAEKSRYKNLPCIESTRVRLKDNSFYHANWVNIGQQHKRFICAQTPLDPMTGHTFWAMVMQEEVETIVMIGTVDDKDPRKGSTHFPLKQMENQWNIYGDYKVTTAKVSSLPGESAVNVYTVLVKFSPTMQKHTVKVYQWTGWPDNGAVPEVAMTIPNILAAVRSSKKPILVHCSSGVGRTGCLVFFEMLMERMISGGPPESVIDTLKDLRSQRYGAVQSELQFLFVLRSILHLLTNRNVVEMSQTLLEFIDDCDALMKKLNNEEKEQREKRIAEGAKETDLCSFLGNELSGGAIEGVPPTSDGNDQRFTQPSSNNF